MTPAAPTTSPSTAAADGRDRRVAVSPPLGPPAGARRQPAPSPPGRCWPGWGVLGGSARRAAAGGAARGHQRHGADEGPGGAQVPARAGAPRGPGRRPWRPAPTSGRWQEPSGRAVPYRTMVEHVRRRRPPGRLLHDRAAAGDADLLPAPFPQTEIWAYNGIYPGPVFRQQQNGSYTVVENSNSLAAGPRHVDPPARLADPAGPRRAPGRRDLARGHRRPSRCRGSTTTA